MKRIITVLLISLAILSSGFAEYRPEMSKPILIQGGYGSVLSLVIEPIAAQSQAYLVGMPFNIEEIFVQYDKTEYGRLIAYWNVVANDQFDLEICASNLHHIKDTVIEPYNLPYNLTFEYDLSYYQDNESVAIPTRRFVVASTDTNDFTVVDDIFKDTQVTAGTFVGALRGNIYFEFTEESSNRIMNQASTVPSGQYESTVTIKMVKK